MDIYYDKLETALQAAKLLPRAKAIMRPWAITLVDILGTSRVPHVCRVRHEVWAMLRAHGYSYPSIGRIVNRDHSSIIKALSVKALREGQAAT